MKSRICFILLLLLGAIVTGIIIGRSGPSVAPVSIPAGGPSTTTASLPQLPDNTSGLDANSPALTDSNGLRVAAANTNGSAVDALEARRLRMSQLRDWASTNFDAALAWVMQMPDSEDRDEALQAVCFGLAQKDPAAAVEKAQELKQPSAVMENLVQQWAGTDLPAAMVWANNQPAGDQRDEMFQRIALILSQSDPKNAAAMVIEQIPEGSGRDEAIMTVLHQWANKDMVAAVDWVKTFPDSPFRERALEELEGIAQYQKDLAASPH